MSHTIIDRRENAKDKSLSNRQRFIERSKKTIREAAKKALGGKSLTDYGDTVVNIPTDGIEEPRFVHDSDFGEYDYVLPGNKDFIVGDTIDKPSDEEEGRQGSDEGDGEDEFQFALTYEEFLDVLFDDLELPDLIKQSEKHTEVFVNHREGYTTSGIPANLNVERTAIAGIGRRIALRGPKLKRIAELEIEMKLCEDNERKAQIKEELIVLRRRALAIGYLDDVDLRYNNFTKTPKPILQAVMICILDVSFSMGEREKIIAKKFFILLSLFLKRRYKNIDIVFIRHHMKAMECNEEVFFTSKEGGGTIVSTGYEKAKEIIAARYDPADWNIYMAQASDGDNFDNDNSTVEKMLKFDLLPVIQHFLYLEISNDETPPVFWFGTIPSTSGLWNTIQPLTNKFKNLSVTKISDEKNVVRAFRNIFKKESS